MKGKKELILILNIILVMVVVLIFFLPMISIVYPFLEIGILVGSSMMPTLKTGDMLFIRNNVEDVKIGDIISFRGGSEAIVHRVVDISRDSSLTFKIKGDNNKEPDGWIRADQTEGKVIYIIPTRFLFSLPQLVTLILLLIPLTIIKKRYPAYKKLGFTFFLLMTIFCYSLGVSLGIYISLK